MGGIEREESKNSIFKQQKILEIWKILKNLEKNKEKKRVTDTKGFKQQNHLDLKCSWKKSLGI
jgi:hypothetical protein